MNTASSNVKSIAVIVFVSLVLFGIFYYLITDVGSSSSLSAQKPQDQSLATNTLLAVQGQPQQQPQQEEVKGNASTTSVFKELSTQKVNVQPKSVLAGTDDREGTQSTVPATGSDTIFGAFVVSSLIMFTGIYLLITKPKNLALVRFEKRIIKDLD